MDNLPFIDNLWDYGKPEVTEKKFLELLQKRNETHFEYFLEVETQLARTQSLQQNFQKAHKILDDVEARLNEKMIVVRIRYLLERGRTYNSNREKESAKKLFEQAFHLAKEHQQDFYSIDSAHMLGIVHDYPENLKWNETAMQIAEKSEGAKARKWLASLYNNIGWAYHDKEDYPTALEHFEKALSCREAEKDIKKIPIAKWCIARCLRSLGKLNEALYIQESIKAEQEDKQIEPDGYVHEELGELYLLFNKKEESKLHFGKAYQLLSADIWMKANETKRLERLEKLSK